MKKETNENEENLKAQVIKAKDRYNELVEKHGELANRERNKRKIGNNGKQRRGNTFSTYGERKMHEGITRRNPESEI